MNDFQRSAVYASEHMVAEMLDRQGQTPVVKIAGSTLTLPAERKFADIESMQRYVDLVAGSGKITVQAAHGNQTAAKAHHKSVISIPTARKDEHRTPWAMREYVLIHETSHCLTTDIGHGPAFIQTYLDLLERCMGPEVAFLFRITFHQNGVK